MGFRNPGDLTGWWVVVLVWGMFNLNFCVMYENDGGVNYILHLNGFFNQVIEDDQLTPIEVSVYLALFRQWNINRFRNPVSLTRADVMNVSKVLSKTTYRRALWALHNAGYILYMPSNSPLVGSKVVIKDLTSMGRRCSGSGSNAVQVRTNGDAVVDQQMVPSLNYINISNGKTSGKTHTPTFDTGIVLEEKNSSAGEGAAGRPGDLDEVEQFFMAFGSDKRDAKRFFRYYNSLGWRLAGKAVIRDWKAVAENWIDNPQYGKGVKLGRVNSHVSIDKNYDEQL